MDFESMRMAEIREKPADCDSHVLSQPFNVQEAAHRIKTNGSLKWRGTAPVI